MPKSGGACRFKSSCSERVRAAGDQQPPIASRRCTVCPFRPVLFARQPPLRCMSFSPEKEQLVSVHFLGEVELTPVSIAKKLNSSFYAQCMSCLPCRPLRPAGRLREPIPRRGARCPFRNSLASSVGLAFIRPRWIEVTFKLLWPWTKPCAPQPFLSTSLTEWNTAHQGCPCIGPPVRMGVPTVIVLDKRK